MTVLQVSPGQDIPAIEDAAKRGEMLDQSLAVLKSVCAKLRISRRRLDFQEALPYIADFARDLRLWRENGDPQKLAMVQTAAGAILKALPHETVRSPYQPPAAQKPITAQGEGYVIEPIIGGGKPALVEPIQESQAVSHIGNVQALFGALRLSLRVLIAEASDRPKDDVRILLSALEARAKNLGGKTQSQKVRLERQVLKAYLEQDQNAATQAAARALQRTGR